MNDNYKTRNAYNLKIQYAVEEIVTALEDCEQLELGSKIRALATAIHYYLWEADFHRDRVL